MGLCVPRKICVQGEVPAIHSLGHFQGCPVSCPVDMKGHSMDCLLVLVRTFRLGTKAGSRRQTEGQELIDDEMRSPMQLPCN